MDPIAHTLFGAAVSRTRLGRAGDGKLLPGATFALVLAANLPDVDVLVYLTGSSDAGLLHRRGWTHGPVAVVVLPLLCALAVRLWERWRSGGTRAAGDSRRLSTGRLLLLSILGVLSHPLLDWLNTYGVRLLAPFDWTWFYGDTLFIVDPWMWLLLGAATVLGTDAGRRGRWGVRAVAVFGVAIVVTAALTAGLPRWVAVAFSGGLALVVWRNERSAGTPVSRRRIATALVAAFGLYVAAMSIAAASAREQVRQAMTDRGHRVTDLMVGPLPGTPLAREWVVETPERYHFGRFGWLGGWQRDARVSPVERTFDRLPEGTEPEARLVREALHDPCIRGFVNWVRFPTHRIGEPGADGAPGSAVRIELFDLRYTREPSTTFGGASSVVEP